MNRRLLFGLVFVLVAVTVPTGVAFLRLGSIAEFWAGGGLGRAGPAVPGSPKCGGRPLIAERQLRGMWLTTVNNIDWPSRPGLPVEKVKAEYLSWLDLAQRLRHNAVFVHVRPSGDALWPSKYAPWSEWLTGRRDGRDPGWDPMAWMIAETHARNLEFHAWFNPYRASQPATVGGPGADFAKLAPSHPLRMHRDWAVTYPANTKNARLYYDPGIPEARKFVEDSILEAVERYDVDGVHFDDFFYPYPEGGDFPDGASYARYGKGVDKSQWRRNNVDTFVREMSERIKALKPWVRFGISPFGIWRNKATDPAGSATSGLQSYDAIYADTRKWVREKWLDYIV
ncbi:MAG TPA: family 10 glycosylhydrolase, partial [Jiangellales bacterium]|nr:family 10 glycosylhydrolase [Jiangellales bacterium]